ncbi:MAG: hypothetical protein LBM77_03115 [Spirochaetaceae bacterium]|nr:hypothetical protein [Spirochaetaceae bacterium]
MTGPSMSCGGGGPGHATNKASEMPTMSMQSMRAAIPNENNFDFFIFSS